jgi:hypothetical protein
MSLNAKNNLSLSAVDAMSIDVTAVDVELDTPARGIIIGVTGNIKITTNTGNVRTLTGLPAGAFPIGCTKVWSSGTTATSITLLF